MKILEVITHPVYNIRKIKSIDKILTQLSGKSLTYVYSLIVSIVLFVILRGIISI